MTRYSLPGDYIGGAFVVDEDASDGSFVRVSPSDDDDILARVFFQREHVEEAVQAAREAFASWSLMPLDERRGFIQRLRDVMALRADDFAERITREVGKPLWEAKTEVAAALNKIDITLSDGLELIAPREMGSRAQRYAFKPHGVGAVLGPFNFPLHLVHGHVVPALIAGNTVVVKPSELAPSVGALYAECFQASGFPRGVFNLVQGEGSVGAKLAAHPDVDVVMFTGSYAVGLAIKRATLDQPHKLLALEMGGRNPAIVLADADLEKAVHDVVWGATVTSGQRCSGTAVALIERAMFEPFVKRAKEIMDGIVVGDPLTPGVFMGPLVHESARDRVVDALRNAERAGAVPLRSFQPIEGTRSGAFMPPTLHHVVKPGALSYETEELFGPDLAVEVVEDLDHALVRASASSYGLSASVFTADQDAFERAWSRLPYGSVNWNAPTCGASSRLPFGGTKRSGNHRPAALFSTLYATYPVATIEGKLTMQGTTPSPGFWRMI